MWRLFIELRHGQKFSESAERRASRIGGALLFSLAVYVAVAAVWRLWTGGGEEFSWPGFIVALVAIPAMRYLAQRKIAIADQIGSRALRADAIEAVTCGWLSLLSPLNGCSMHGGLMRWFFGNRLAAGQRGPGSMVWRRLLFLIPVALLCAATALERRNSRSRRA